MRALQLLIIVNSCLLVYATRLPAPYVADDHSIFYRLQQNGLFGFASQPPTSFFRPLISLHSYLDYWMGMSPLFSHAVNLLWHTGCALLLYALGYRLLVRWGWNRGRALFAAYLGASLFAVLPANVEAVAWFAARADLVATAGALGALLLLMRFQARGRRRDYLAALTCFSLGLLCKESLLTFPVIAWLWLRFLGVERAGRLVMPFFGVLLGYLMMRTVVVGGVGAYPEAWATLQRPWLLGVNMAAYLLQMGMPAALYGLGSDRWDTLLWGMWAVGAGFSIYAWRKASPTSSPQVNWRLLAGFAGIALVPVLIFKPSPLYFLNSRYSYLASAFVAVAVGALIARLGQRNRLMSVAWVVVFLAYYFGALRQADAWREAGMLARRSVLSLANAPTDQPLLILSLPDHFHGAYIWRTGFHEGVAILLPDRASQPMFVASRFTMRLRTDTSVQYANGVATLSNPYDIFLPPEGVRTPAGNQPIVLPDKLVIHWSLAQHYTLLRYEAGNLVPMSQQVQSSHARRD